MKKITQLSQYTRKQRILQKTRWTTQWVGLFLGLMLLALLLGPFFLTSHHQAYHLAQFLNKYAWLFWALHGAFILSSLWWWPAYIRARGKRSSWPDDMIERAAAWKWAVMMVLLFLCLLFLLT